MNLIELQQYTISEDKSEDYLRQQGILNQFDCCPYCKSARSAGFGGASSSATNVGKNGDQDVGVSWKG